MQAVKYMFVSSVQARRTSIPNNVVHMHCSLAMAVCHNTFERCISIQALADIVNKVDIAVTSFAAFALLALVSFGLAAGLDLAGLFEFLSSSSALCSGGPFCALFFEPSSFS